MKHTKDTKIFAVAASLLATLALSSRRHDVKA
jgi:hypothetical protein